MAREYTKEECVELFINHFKGLVEYWDKEERAATPKEKLEGLLHSILCTFDGVAAMMPAFYIVPARYPGDEEFCIQCGLDYWPDDLVLNDGVVLHELL